MKIFEYIIKLQDLASGKLKNVGNNLHIVQQTSQTSQAKVQKNFSKTTKSINYLNNRLSVLDKKRTASTSIRGIMKLNTQIIKTNRQLSRLKNLPPAGVISRLRQMGRSVGGFIGLAGGAFLVRDSFGKMEEQMQAVGQVQTGLESTNGKVGYSLEQLKEKASGLQDNSIFGDESILQNTTAQLLTFTNITGSAFNGAQQAVLDITSRLKGTKATSEDLRSTSIMLGKALNDPVANLSALSRSGIQFSEEQKKMIKGMVESGKLSEAQTLIIEELNKQYGGSAEALSKTGLGPLKQFKNAIGDLQEKLASAFLPLLKGIVKPLKRMTDWLNKNGETVKKITPFILGFAGGVLILKKVFLGYKIVAMMVSTATTIWTGVQWLLNAALTANPIGLIIAGIVALIAVITYVIYKTSGWGKMWKHTVKGAKLLFKAFSLKAKADFNTLVNGIMIGINKIKLGWYKFKEAVGMGDSNKNQAMIKRIQENTEQRKKEIIEKQKQAIQTGIDAIEEFAKAGKSLKWDKTKTFSGAKDKVMKKIGIEQPAVPGIDPTKTDNSTTTSKNNKEGNKTNRAIATGGTKHNYITLNINKEMIGNILIKGKDFKESAKQMQEYLKDSLLRTMALATTA